jgi:hypothetical protein
MRLRGTPEVANDNPWEPPVVRTPAGRPEAAYARSENLILPLRFARQLPEWARRKPEMRPLERVWRARAAHASRVLDRLFSR